MFIIGNNHSAAYASEHACIMLLLMVAVERIRNKHRRAASQGDFGNGHCPCAGDYQVSAVKGSGDVIDERDDPGLAAERAISLLHQPRVSLPSLMSDGHWNNIFLQFPEGAATTEIEAMSTAGAA